MYAGTETGRNATGEARTVFHGIPILDFHVNFVPRRPAGTPGRAGGAAYRQALAERWRRAWDFLPRSEEFDRPEDLADRWAEEMDRYGIDLLVFVHKLCDDDAMARALARHPGRFLAFANHHVIDPADPDALPRLRRAVEELGFVGYKLVGPLMRVPLDDPALEPIWQYLAARRLPVNIHFGPYGQPQRLIVYHPAINPLCLAPVAARYPEIPFVVSHFGCGYWRELLQLCWAHPNVYIDTSGTHEWTRWMPYRLTLEDLFRKAYETVGPERIVFGTDSRDFPQGYLARVLQDQFRACVQLNMRDEDLKLIFGGNAARLLGIPWPPRSGEGDRA